MDIQKTHADALRLLRVLVTGGADSAEPMADAWILQKARQASFGNQELFAALTYAVEQGWIDKGPKELSLTVAGVAAARR